MNDEMFSELVIVKRSGQRVNFNGTKIALAIKSAFDSVYDESEAASINKVYEKVLKNIYDNYKDRKTINVEDIQDIIENELQNLGFTKVYESFNTYRLRRAASRESFSVKQQHKFVKAMEKLALTAKKDVNSSPHDTLYDFGKIISNQFTKSYLLDYKYVRSHDEGNIYIKGLDYYALGTSKSSILDFSKIKVNDYYLDYLRRLIINIKSEEYGEQSIPDIDFLLEEYALNIFKKIFKDNLGYSLELFGILDYLDFNNISDEIDMLDKIEFDNKIFIKYIKSKRALELFNKSYDYALKEYLKHLESKLYIFFNALNLNNNNLGLNAIAFSLGNNKSKIGLDIKKIIIKLFKDNNFNNLTLIDKINNKDDIDEVNDLIINNKNIKLSINTLAEYLPNGDRIYENINNEKLTSVGRLILADTSINLVRIAFVSKDKKEFLEKVERAIETTKNELIQAFEYMSNKYKEDFKYLFQDDILLDSEKLEIGQKVRKIIKSGTLNISVAGIREAITLIDKKDDIEEEIELIKFMRNKIDNWSELERLNFTLSEVRDKEILNYFLSIDKSIYGTVDKITDKEYYSSFTNRIEDLKYFSKYQELMSGGGELVINIPKNTSNKKIKEIVDLAVTNKIKFMSIKVGEET